MAYLCLPRIPYGKTMEYNAAVKIQVMVGSKGNICKSLVLSGKGRLVAKATPAIYGAIHGTSKGR